VAHRFLQGYNAQAAATADQVIVAAEVTQDTNDIRQLAPLLEATSTHLDAAGLKTPVGTFVADAGYWSAANASIETESELLIATAPPGGRPRRSVTAEVDEMVDRVIHANA